MTSRLPDPLYETRTKLERPLGPHVCVELRVRAIVQIDRDLLHRLMLRVVSADFGLERPIGGLFDRFEEIAHQLPKILVGDPFAAQYGPVRFQLVMGSTEQPTVLCVGLSTEGKGLFVVYVQIPSTPTADSIRPHVCALPPVAQVHLVPHCLPDVACVALRVARDTLGAGAVFDPPPRSDEGVS